MENYITLKIYHLLEHKNYLTSFKSSNKTKHGITNNRNMPSQSHGCHIVLDSVSYDGRISILMGNSGNFLLELWEQENVMFC